MGSSSHLQLDGGSFSSRVGLNVVVRENPDFSRNKTTVFNTSMTELFWLKKEREKYENTYDF
jgi:hypothetical protein